MFKNRGFHAVISMKKRNSISLFYLIMISLALVVSIRNLPTIAAMGMHMIFFGIITAVLFFIPGALVSAELATGWPEMGGIAVWVKEAFGKRWGFVAIWLQWTYMISSVISMLYFISSSLAFVFDESLVANKTYLIICQLIFIWGFTFLNLKGLNISKVISSIGFLAGVLFPALLIITLSVIYILQNHPVQMDFSLTYSNYFPDFKHISTIVLLIGFMRALAGVEVSAAHANDVENPKKSFPIAIFVVVLIVGLGKINPFLMKGDVMTQELNEVFCFEKTCKDVGCNKCIQTKLETHEWYPCSKLYSDNNKNLWREYWTCEDDEWGKR